ncbi:hypothetical protein CLV51_11091 [Chitinophaga niastensis]|uniref:Uncharacterized protein n=2 Tax=Chitinophaga niastensis TaxID=536980 RepID=A0A2P8H9J1_CHINA|nr:hypothetical protein CLV51_11091 [Chitinophaga niastensis]
MNTHCSCNTATGSSVRKTISAPSGQRLSFRQRFVNFMRVIIPGIILALLPKCPFCLAAYVAVGTGIGLSVTTARYLRTGLVVLCVGSLVYLAASRVKIIYANNGVQQKIPLSGMVFIILLGAVWIYFL